MKECGGKTKFILKCLKAGGFLLTNACSFKKSGASVDLLSFTEH